MTKLTCVVIASRFKFFITSTVGDMTVFIRDDTSLVKDTCCEHLPSRGHLLYIILCNNVA